MCTFGLAKKSDEKSISTLKMEDSFGQVGLEAQKQFINIYTQIEG